MAGTHTFTFIPPPEFLTALNLTPGPRGCTHCACVLLLNGKYKESLAATEELDESQVRRCPAAPPTAAAAAQDVEMSSPMRRAIGEEVRKVVSTPMRFTTTVTLKTAAHFFFRAWLNRELRDLDPHGNCDRTGNVVVIDLAFSVNNLDRANRIIQQSLTRDDVRTHLPLAIEPVTQQQLFATRLWQYRASEDSPGPKFGTRPEGDLVQFGSGVPSSPAHRVDSEATPAQDGKINAHIVHSRKDEDAIHAAAALLRIDEADVEIMRGPSGPRVALSSAVHALFDTYHFWFAWHVDPSDRTRVLLAPRFVPGLADSKRDILERELPGYDDVLLGPQVLEALRLRKYLTYGCRGMCPRVPSEESEAERSECW